MLSSYMQVLKIKFINNSEQSYGYNQTFQSKQKKKLL